MGFKKLFSKKLKLVFISVAILLFAIFGYLNLPFKTEPVSPVPEQPADFSLILLPDTQIYTKSFPEIFKRQTQWIVDYQKEKNIVFVSHLGDITDSWNNVAEWKVASQAISFLDGVVPYGLLLGNHDDPKMFNFYFPLERFEDEIWYGGHYGQDYSNNYQLFSAGGMDFVILHLEFEPTKKILDWADEILKTNSSRQAIVVSHYILNYDGFRSSVGQKIFEALSDNPNLFLMLSGHAHIESNRVDFVDGRPIYQLLADYQDRPNGGNGWLRILKFVPAEDKIYVRTYSPYLDQFETDSNSQFELKYEMD